MGHGLFSPLRTVFNNHKGKNYVGGEKCATSKSKLFSISIIFKIALDKISMFFVVVVGGGVLFFFFH